MHIAAMKPLSLNLDSLDKKIVDKEKEIQLESIKSSGKPDEIVNKILEGKMKKFYSEVIFSNQKYILDEEKSVNQIITEFNNKNGKFKVVDFSLFVLGS